MTRLITAVLTLALLAGCSHDPPAAVEAGPAQRVAARLAQAPGLSQVELTVSADGDEPTTLADGGSGTVAIDAAPTRLALLVTPSDTVVTAGDVVELAVDAYRVTELFGAAFELRYDGGLLAPVDVSAGDGLGGDVLEFHQIEAGLLAVSVVKRRGDTPLTATGPARLAVARFEAVDAGTTNLTFAPATLALQRSDGTDVPGLDDLLLIGGRVSVE
jgi:hypothetical protein